LKNIINYPKVSSTNIS